MKVWSVTWETNTGNESSVVSVWSTKEAAEAEAKRLLRLAFAAGESTYTNPDDPDYEDTEWSVDYTVDGPHELDVPYDDDVYGELSNARGKS